MKNQDVKSLTLAEINNMTGLQLRALCKELDIKAVSSLRKTELVNKITVALAKQRKFEGTAEAVDGAPEGYEENTFETTLISTVIQPSAPAQEVVETATEAPALKDSDGYRGR